MLQKNIPVLYKNQPAVIEDFSDGKYQIKFRISNVSGKGQKFGTQKVREKDILLLSGTPLKSFEDFFSFEYTDIETKFHEAWELLCGEDNDVYSFKELAEIVDSNFGVEKTYALFEALTKSVEFEFDEAMAKNGCICFRLRTEDEIKNLKQKMYEKEHEAEIYGEFIKRLKEKKLLPEDSKFMGEVEALALGKTEKSKIMVEIGLAQSPENAHRLLIDTGVWTFTKNPYPTRFGLSMYSAAEGLGAIPEEERLIVDHIAYAIDSPWSVDPDDAVAFDGKYLWVHIADPASYVMPGSPIDKIARGRGTTLYIPDGAARMLAETSLEDYALGLKKISFALSFRLLLNEDSSINECMIFKTQVQVQRLTYQEADDKKESKELKPLFDIAEKNIARRKKSGAIKIDLPEVHIEVESQTKKVSIIPYIHYLSDAMICEMMLLAGEGAAHFAFKNSIPFPFVSQDAPDMPSGIEDGLAGQFRLLKSMRKRNVGITPAMHFGLGLALYSQVTSPLRRYGDLIAHQQLRAFIDKKTLIDKDTMLERISEGDAASVAARKASRLSEIHWKLIYLLQNPDWQGEAICVDKRNAERTLFIPSLAFQTSINSNDNIELNDVVTLKVSKIDITTQKCEFVEI